MLRSSAPRRQRLRDALCGAALSLTQLQCGTEPPLAFGGHDAGSRGDNEGSRDDPDAGPDDDSVEPASAARERPEPDRTSGACPATESRCHAFTEARPDRLSEHSAVYDPESLLMYVFGGTHSVPVNCAPGGVEFTDEFWLYDDPCGAWRKLPSTGPSARGRHMATFGDGKMWLFGGRYRAGTTGPYELYYDLWAYDPTTESWEVWPTQDLQPTARINSAFVYDEARNALWLMGGNQSEHGSEYLPTNDVWIYSIDEQSWAQPNVSVGPSPRLFHGALLDPNRDRLVVFGGANENAFTGAGGYFGDLWALDLETLQWSELAPRLSGPQGRFWSALVYDTNKDEYVLFGGHDDDVLGNRNDTWRFSPVTGSWTQVESEDTFRAEARGTCDFPPDFADISLDLPERRNAHAFVWSEPCGHALMFGGKTDCGSTDDVWRYADDGWSPQNHAREGEVCLRWRKDTSECTDICF